VSALFTQCPGDTVQTGTGKVDPTRKFKCTTAALELGVQLSVNSGLFYVPDWQSNSKSKQYSTNTDFIRQNGKVHQINHPIIFGGVPILTIIKMYFIILKNTLIILKQVSEL